MLGTTPDNHRLVVVRVLFGFGRLTVDVGLLAPGAVLRTIRPFVAASQSLAFPLGRRALAFIREAFPLVCHAFALVGDSLPPVGDLISTGSDQLAPFDLSLTLQEGLLTRVEFGGCGFGRTGTVVCDPGSP